MVFIHTTIFFLFCNSESWLLSWKVCRPWSMCWCQGESSVGLVRASSPAVWGWSSSPVESGSPPSRLTHISTSMLEHSPPMSMVCLNETYFLYKLKNTHNERILYISLENIDFFMYQVLLGQKWNWNENTEKN